MFVFQFCIILFSYFHVNNSSPFYKITIHSRSFCSRTDLALDGVVNLPCSRAWVRCSYYRIHFDELRFLSASKFQGISRILLMSSTWFPYSIASLSQGILQPDHLKDPDGDRCAKRCCEAEYWSQLPRRGQRARKRRGSKRCGSAWRLWKPGWGEAGKGQRWTSR